jgi:predicted aldo/keto reductase-like oxidoreductase
MKYRKMPKTGDGLSILGYGCMRFPTTAGRIDKETAVRQVRSAVDQGVNYLDTGYHYHGGASESFLGEYVLSSGYRNKVKVATKLPPYAVRKREDMDRILDRQLEKLKTDRIDYYLLHGIEGNSWRKLVELGIFEFMDRIKASGKALRLGFSYHGTREDFYTIIDAYDWDFCQVQFNILDEYYQAGIDGIRYAAEREIGVIVMEPLRGGQLTEMVPAEVQAIYDEAPAERSPAEWALRWVWSHPEVQVVLSGMNRDEHIRENIRIASEAEPDSFSDTELASINRVREAYQRLLEIGCTGCRYCLPCPAGIDIPLAFQAYNIFRLYGRRHTKMMYAITTGFYPEKPAWTRGCIDCGKCEERCPQHIEIRKEFAKVRKHLEGPGIRLLAAVARPIMNRGRKRDARGN